MLKRDSGESDTHLHLSRYLTSLISLYQPVDYKSSYTEDNYSSGSKVKLDHPHNNGDNYRSYNLNGCLIYLFSLTH